MTEMHHIFNSTYVNCSSMFTVLNPTWYRAEKWNDGVIRRWGEGQVIKIVIEKLSLTFFEFFSRPYLCAELCCRLSRNISIRVY